MRRLEALWMLRVKTPDEVLALIEESFSPLEARCESTELCDAVGRVLAEDICAAEFVPDFDRSTVDGYAVRAEDTFGCSDSLPAVERKRRFRQASAAPYRRAAPCRRARTAALCSNTPRITATEPSA